MNNCILMAEIVQAPQLRYTSDNQTPIAEMLVQFPGLRDEDPPATLKVVGWGNLAQEIQEQYHQGDHVVIEGRLGMNMLDRPEGFKEKRAELTAQKIHRLEGGGMTTNTAAPAETIAAKPRDQQAKTPSRPPAAKPAASEPSYAPAAKAAAYAPSSTPEQDYDDIPFVRPVESKASGDDLIDSGIHRPRVGFEYLKF